ncbi:MAG TPA: SPOR domain-containing protein [Desulfatiglandales bacterium]|nr:SPOR domain-containing protein [Desulfatiglandales bacterium]
MCSLLYEERRDLRRDICWILITYKNMFKIRSKNKGQTKRYNIELTAISALFWAIFLFFLLIWIFVLGILIGSGFLPGSLKTIAELKGQIKSLQETISHKEAVDTSAPKKMDNEPDLAFYDALANKKAETKNNWKPEAEADSGNIKKEKSSLENKSDQKPLKDRDMLITDQKALKDEGVLIRASEKRENLYTVQIASIEDKEKAEKLVIDLIGQGYDAYSYEVDVNGKIYYRVRCGRFSSRQEAADYAQTLEKEAGLKGFVSRIE